VPLLCDWALREVHQWHYEPTRGPRENTSLTSCTSSCRRMLRRLT